MSTKRYTSTGQKALAFGLASATCLGVVGLISVRNAQEATAAADEYTLTASTTSTGVTQAQLDQYAVLLGCQQGGEINQGWVRSSSWIAPLQVRLWSCA